MPWGSKKTHVRKYKSKVKLPSKKTPRSVKTLKKLIRKEIAIASETKCEMGLTATVNLQNGGISMSPARGSALAIMPTVFQGGEINERLGNKVKPVSLVLRGIVRCNPYDVTTNNNLQPFMVDMYIVSNKSSKAVVTPEMATNFFKFQNGTVGYQGSLLNRMNPINSVQWTLHKHKVFKMACTDITPPDSNNNGSRFWYTFSIKIKAPLLQYQDDLTGYPTNYMPYVLFGVTNVDNTTAAGQYRATVNLESFLFYDDM